MNDYRGVAERSKASGSNPDYGNELTEVSRIVGSNPTAPAIYTYIDADTGKEVTEDWWP